MAVPAKKTSSLKDILADKKDETVTPDAPVAKDNVVQGDVPNTITHDVDDDGRNADGVLIVDSDPESDNNDPIIQHDPATEPVQISEDGENGPYAVPANKDHIPNWKENHNHNLGLKHPDALINTLPSEHAHVTHTVSETVYAGPAERDDKFLGDRETGEIQDRHTAHGPDDK